MALTVRSLPHPPADERSAGHRCLPLDWSTTCWQIRFGRAGRPRRTSRCCTMSARRDAVTASRGCSCASQCGRSWLLPAAGLLVLVHDGLRDPAPSRHRHVVRARPFTQLRDVELTPRLRPVRRRSRLAPAPTGRRTAPGRLDVRSNIFRNAVAFFLLRSISKEVPSSANDTVSTASPPSRSSHIAEGLRRALLVAPYH